MVVGRKLKRYGTKRLTNGCAEAAPSRPFVKLPRAKRTTLQTFRRTAVTRDKTTSFGAFTKVERSFVMWDTHTHTYMI